MRPPNLFAGSVLERAADRRSDPEWVERRWREPGTRIVPVWRSRVLLAGREEPRAVTLAVEDVDRCCGPGLPILSGEHAAAPILLGVQDGHAVFALDFPDSGEAASPLADRGEFQDLHRMGALLPRHDGALLAYARAIVEWHRMHRYCGACGAATRPREAGHVRVCGDPECGRSHFPRTDPAIIVLVTDGETCLLGRKAEWPARVYSTLAGFVEPGESLGDAVRREVREESGILVGDVRYHSSQPWPFPASLMLGFRAVRTGGALRLDGRELEDARWFAREELRARVRRREIALPSAVSIARRLIAEWLWPDGPENDAARA